MWFLVQDRPSSYSSEMSSLRVTHFVTNHSDPWCGQSIFQMNKLRFGAVKWFIESARKRRSGSDLGLFL